GGCRYDVRRTRRHVPGFRHCFCQPWHHRQYRGADGHCARRRCGQPGRHHGRDHTRVSEDLDLEEMRIGRETSDGPLVEREETMTKKIVLVVAMMSCLMRAGTVHAQTPAPDAQPAAAPAAAQPAVSVAPITGADLNAPVKPTDRANGDPDGSLTGTA